MTNKEVRDCENCKHYVLHDKTVNLPPIYACEKWECEFELKEMQNVKTIQIMIDKRGAVTNGDVIKAVFPNITIIEVFGGDILFKVDNSYLRTRESWWNSPYKECDKE